MTPAISHGLRPTRPDRYEMSAGQLRPIPKYDLRRGTYVIGGKRGVHVIDSTSSRFVRSASALTTGLSRLFRREAVGRSTLVRSDAAFMGDRPDGCSVHRGKPSTLLRRCRTSRRVGCRRCRCFLGVVGVWLIAWRERLQPHVGTSALQYEQSLCRHVMTR